MKASAGKRIIVPIDKCPECGASYARFRGGLSVGHAAWELAATHGTIDEGGDSTYAVASEQRSEDNASEANNLGAAMRLAGERKRAAWAEQHGPGRCRFDVEGFIIDYRRNMTGVVVLDDREWRLREIVADLILDEEDTANEESTEADTGFDVDEWDAVPVFVDDGNATTYIAA